MNEIIKEEIKEVVAVDKETGELYVPQAVADHIAYIERFEKEAKKQRDDMRAKLKEAMEEYGIEKIETDNLIVNYVAEGEQIRVDSKALQKFYPDVYDVVSKVTPVKSSVRIKIK
jgi:hypothetical protein